jgi:hypothetical protein
MPPVVGQRTVLSGNQSIRGIDMAQEIMLLQPSAAPLTILTKRLQKSSAIDPKIQWAEDDLSARFSACPAGATNVATTFAVTAGQGVLFGPQDTILDTATLEMMRVTSVATDTLTVVRGIGTTAQTIGAGDEILILGSAAMEGDVSKASRTDNATVVSNFLQIFRKPVELTETQRNSQQLVTPNDWDQQSKKIGIEHVKEIEYANLFGHPAEDTTGTNARRYSGGVTHYIATNITNVGGTLTEASFWAALRPAFRFGSDTKLLLASGLLVDVLNNYPRGKVQVVNQQADTYGVKVMQYQSPHGLLNVVRHWLLEGTKFGGYGVIVDLAQTKYRYLQNRDTQIKEQRQAPDADSRKDEYLTEAGLQFGLEKTHALLKGVTG